VANPAAFFLRLGRVSVFVFLADAVLLDCDSWGAFASGSTASSMPNSDAKSDHPPKPSCGDDLAGSASIEPLSGGPEVLVAGACDSLEDGL